MENKSVLSSVLVICGTLCFLTAMAVSAYVTSVNTMFSFQSRFMAEAMKEQGRPLSEMQILSHGDLRYLVFFIFFVGLAMTVAGIWMGIKRGR